MQEEAGYYPLKAFRFNSFAKEFTLHYDIDSYTYYAQIKNKKKEVVATFQVIKGDDFIVISIPSETLLELPADTYYYDIKQMNIDNFMNRIIHGEFILKDGVTELP